MIKRILVPLDFSEGSMAALAQASELAREAGAVLVVIHADEFPVLQSGELPCLPPHVIEEHATSLKGKVDAAVAPVRASGVAVDAKVVTGPAHQVILDASASEGADLVVMGTHGRRGFRHLVAGSVAERVARTSKVPVMTVRRAPERAA